MWTICFWESILTICNFISNPSGVLFQFYLFFLSRHLCFPLRPQQLPRRAALRPGGLYPPDRAGKEQRRIRAGQAGLHPSSLWRRRRECLQEGSGLSSDCLWANPCYGKDAEWNGGFCFYFISIILTISFSFIFNAKRFTDFKF